MQVSNSQFVTLGPVIKSFWSCGSDYLELISSRVLGLCSVYNHLDKLGLEWTKDDVELQLFNDVNQLLEFQGALGGFGLWSRHSVSSSFLSTHAAHALWEVHELGTRIIVSSASLDRCRSFVDSASRAPITSKKDVKARAYASYVGAKMGACVVSAAQAKVVAMEEDHCDLDTLGWLLGAVCLSLKLLDLPKKKSRFSTLWTMLGPDTASKERADALHAIVGRMLDLLEGKIVVKPEVTKYSSHYDFLSSETRGLAVAFEGLQRVLEEPDDTIAKLGNLSKKELIHVYELIMSKRLWNGRWGTIHESCFCCVALARYFTTLESEKLLRIAGGLEVVARDGITLEHHDENAFVHSICLDYNDMHGEEQSSDDKASEVFVKSNAAYVVVSVDRMHPSVAHVYPVSSGFQLTRNFEFMDNAADIKYEEKAQKYVVKLGARLRVRLTFSPYNDSSFQVLLRDHLGAGFETVNGRLIGSATGGRWHDFLSVKKNCIEVFADRLTGKIERSFTFVVQATSLGTFIVPPSYICELYKKDSFARSRSCLVDIVK